MLKGMDEGKRKRSFEPEYEPLWKFGEEYFVVVLVVELVVQPCHGGCGGMTVHCGIELHIISASAMQCAHDRFRHSLRAGIIFGWVEWL